MGRLRILLWAVWIPRGVHTSRARPKSRHRRNRRLAFFLLTPLVRALRRLCRFCLSRRTVPVGPQRSTAGGCRAPRRQVGRAVGCGHRRFRATWSVAAGSTLPNGRCETTWRTRDCCKEKRKLGSIVSLRRDPCECGRWPPTRTKKKNVGRRSFRSARCVRPVRPLLCLASSGACSPHPRRSHQRRGRTALEAPTRERATAVAAARARRFCRAPVACTSSRAAVVPLLLPGEPRRRAVWEASAAPLGWRHPRAAQRACRGRAPERC